MSSCRDGLHMTVSNHGNAGDVLKISWTEKLTLDLSLFGVISRFIRARLTPVRFTNTHVCAVTQQSDRYDLFMLHVYRGSKKAIGHLKILHRKAWNKSDVDFNRVKNEILQNEEENIKWPKRKWCDWRQTSLCGVYLCSWIKCWPIAHIHHWLCLLFSSCVLAECMSNFAFLQSDIWGWVSVYKISWCLNNHIKLDDGGVWSAHADCILFITRSGKRTGGASKGEEMQNEGTPQQQERRRRGEHQKEGIQFKRSSRGAIKALRLVKTLYCQIKL